MICPSKTDILAMLDYSTFLGAILESVHSHFLLHTFFYPSAFLNHGVLDFLHPLVRSEIRLGALLNNFHHAHVSSTLKLTIFS